MLTFHKESIKFIKCDGWMEGGGAQLYRMDVPFTDLNGKQPDAFLYNWNEEIDGIQDVSTITKLAIADILKVAEPGQTYLELAVMERNQVRTFLPFHS